MSMATLTHNRVRGREGGGSGHTRMAGHEARARGLAYTPSPNPLGKAEQRGGARPEAWQGAHPEPPPRPRLVSLSGAGVEGESVRGNAEVQLMFTVGRSQE